MKRSNNPPKTKQPKIDIDTYLLWVAKSYIPIFDYLYSRLAITKEVRELVIQTFEAHVAQLDKDLPLDTETLKISLYKAANDSLIEYLESHDLDETELARFECNEDQQYIQVLLQTLSSEQQNLVSLKFFTELNNSQIAQILEIDTKKLKKTMQNALLEFKKAYVKFNPDLKDFDYETNG